jgi:hypothetical protein
MSDMQNHKDETIAILIEKIEFLIRDRDFYKDLLSHASSRREELIQQVNNLKKENEQLEQKIFEHMNPDFREKNETLNPLPGTVQFISKDKFFKTKVTVNQFVGRFGRHPEHMPFVEIVIEPNFNMAFNTKNKMEPIPIKSRRYKLYKDGSHDYQYIEDRDE